MEMIDDKIMNKRKLTGYIVCLAAAAGAFISCGKSMADGLLPKVDIRPEQDINKVDTTYIYDLWGINWNGTAADNLLYAKQLRHKAIMYMDDMEYDQNAADMEFFFDSPEPYACSNYQIWPGTTYSESLQKEMEEALIWRDPDAKFPDNLVSGYIHNGGQFYELMADLRKQWVIDRIVEKCIEQARETERKDRGFVFGGVAWDIPGLAFAGVDLPAKYNGEPPKIEGMHYDYDTYVEGRAAYFKKLFSEIRKIWPGARFIFEPTSIYSHWIKDVENRPDAKELMPDLLIQEGSGMGGGDIQFVDDKNIFNSPLFKDMPEARLRSMLGCTTPDVWREDRNRIIAGNAAAVGSTFFWKSRFGGTGDMPSYQSIREVPDRLKLIRVVSIWENKNATPLDQRKWDSSTGIYTSPTAYLSPDGYAAVQYETGRIFVVFNKADGKIVFPPAVGKRAFDTDDMFMEWGEVDDIEVSPDGVMTLKNPDGVGEGYILK